MNQSQIRILKKLVNQNSYTTNKFGVDKVAKIIQDLMFDLPLVWEVTKHYKKGNLYFAKTENWDNSKPTILLNGHLDTVFEENWEISIDGNKFFAPGSMDMKAGILVIIEAVNQLYKENKLQNIMILLTPDEEYGMDHLDKQIEYYKKADYALVFEEGTHVTGEKIDSKERGVAIGRKGLSFFDIKFEGRGGHHAKFLDKKSRHSAISEMAKKITSIESLSDFEKGTLVNVGIAGGGSAPNAIAEHAGIRVDIRYGNRGEIDRIKSELKKVLEPFDPEVKIIYEETYFYPSFEVTDKNREVAQIAVEEGRKLGLNVHPEYRSAGSEANFISEYNSECGILDGFGVVGAGDHSEEEYFLIDSFQDSINLTVNVIKQLLK